MSLAREASEGDSTRRAFEEDEASPTVPAVEIWEEEEEMGSTLSSSSRIRQAGEEESERRKRSLNRAVGAPGERALRYLA